MSGNGSNAAFSGDEGPGPLPIRSPGERSRHATAEDAPDESDTQRSQTQASNGRQTGGTAQQPGPNASRSNTQQPGPTQSGGNTRQQGRNGDPGRAPPAGRPARPPGRTAGSGRTTRQAGQNGPSGRAAASGGTNPQISSDTPDIVLPSIKDEDGRRILRGERRKAVARVLEYQPGEFWAMLALDASRVTRSHARNQYRRLCLRLHPDKHPEADRPRAQQAQSRQYEVPNRRTLPLTIPRAQCRKGCCGFRSRCR